MEFEKFRPVSQKTDDPGTAAPGIPYFVSAMASGSESSQDIERWLGIFVHLCTWVSVFAVDLDLLIAKNDSANSKQLGYKLQLAAVVTTSIALGFIVLMSVIPFCIKSINFSGPNAAYLPPFVTSIIVTGVRASLLCSFMLLLSEKLTPALGDDAWVSSLLALVILKMYLVSLALNNSRLKGHMDKSAGSYFGVN